MNGSRQGKSDSRRARTKRHMIPRQHRQDYHGGTEKGPDDGTTHGVDFSWGAVLSLSKRGLQPIRRNTKFGNAMCEE